MITDKELFEDMDNCCWCKEPLLEPYTTRRAKHYHNNCITEKIKSKIISKG